MVKSIASCCDPRNAEAQPGIFQVSISEIGKERRLSIKDKGRHKDGPKTTL